jgi:endonuclease YncB( thermonuclease family)
MTKRQHTAPRDPAPSTTLEDATYENTAEFTLRGFRGPARLLRAYDGDTVHVAIECVDPVSGVQRPHRICVRLLGINTAEIHGASEAERESAQRAKAALESQLCGHELTVHIAKADKYGTRWLGTFATPACADVNAWMIEQGHASKYSGTGTKAFPTDEV